MYLKSIEIHGFKSFANRIKLDFKKGTTAIVGPNGSGKSNVADAVRWVLGEQRIKQLRGASMQDVIFSGTELRKPQGYAYVAITLDNSDHVLAIDYEEVTVSRRLYRSGESEYMINGSLCRLKDISELFYDTGIGKEGYSIIGQGQIDQILSSKPEDRRSLFDEAAGIVKFKVRKDAAIKKLEDEKNNLTRLSDIIIELEKQTAPLEKQSETAKVYLKNKERLKFLDINMFLVDNEKLKIQLKDVVDKLSIAGNDLDDTARQYSSVKQEYGNIADTIVNVEADIDTARTSITDNSVKKEKLEGQIGILKEQIRSASDNEKHFLERKKALENDISIKEKEKKEISDKKKVIDDALTDILKAAAEKKKSLSDTEHEIELNNSAIEELKNGIITTLNERASIKSKQSSLKTMREQIGIHKAELTSRLVRAQSDQELLDRNIRRCREEFQKVNDEIIEITGKQKENDNELAEIKVQLTEKDASLREQQALLQQEKSKLEALSNLTERYEGYGGSVRRVMEKKGSGSGIAGVVADIISTDAKYETAIEIALGGNIQNIVTEDEDTAKKMIAFLKETKAGRATFLPLTSIKNPQTFKTPEVLKEKGVIGLADELVKTASEYRDVAKTLLGRIVIADNIDSAVRIARKFHYSIRICTLDGELLVPGGAISGGAFKNSSNLLGRRREMSELQKHIVLYDTKTKELQKEISDIRDRRGILRTVAEEIRESLQKKFIEQNTARLNTVREEEKQKESQGSFYDLKTENDSIEGKLAEISIQEKEAAASYEKSVEMEQNASTEIEKAQSKLNELNIIEQRISDEAAKQEIEVSKISQQQEFEQENEKRISNELKSILENLDEINGGIESGNKELEQKQQDIEAIMLTVESSVTKQKDIKEKLILWQKHKEEMSQKQKELFKTQEELSERKASLDKEVTRLAAQKEKYESGIESQINYMWDEYEITLSDASNERDASMTDTHSMKKEILELRDAIKKLGNVNVNAIEEYKNLMERYTFMKTQHDDLISAQEKLKTIISELDELMRRQFTEQFGLINKEFNKVFSEMFGGGRGSLELVEGEDILEAGIRIIAQPPGKRLQNMMQLSGGEKSLTAIALLFAIQNLKPSPFCMLDEIEAALDENNVIRFARYLHKLKSTQFIVITHRRGTMESADCLYGITMQEKGVSTLVSVNLIDKELTN